MLTMEREEREKSAGVSTCKRTLLSEVGDCPTSLIVFESKGVNKDRRFHYFPKF